MVNIESLNKELAKFGTGYTAELQTKGYFAVKCADNAISKTAIQFIEQYTGYRFNSVQIERSDEYNDILTAYFKEQ